MRRGKIRRTDGGARVAIRASFDVHDNPGGPAMQVTQPHATAMFQNATPMRPGLTLRNVQGTNRARIGQASLYAVVHG